MDSDTRCKLDNIRVRIEKLEQKLIEQNTIIDNIIKKRENLSNK